MLWCGLIAHPLPPQPINVGSHHKTITFYYFCLMELPRNGGLLSWSNGLECTSAEMTCRSCCRKQMLRFYGLGSTKVLLPALDGVSGIPLCPPGHQHLHEMEKCLLRTTQSWVCCAAFTYQGEAAIFHPWGSTIRISRIKFPSRGWKILKYLPKYLWFVYLKVCLSKLEFHVFSAGYFCLLRHLSQ